MRQKGRERTHGLLGKKHSEHVLIGSIRRPWLECITICHHFPHFLSVPLPSAKSYWETPTVEFRQPVHHAAKPSAFFHGHILPNMCDHLCASRFSNSYLLARISRFSSSVQSGNQGTHCRDNSTPSNSAKECTDFRTFSNFISHPLSAFGTLGHPYRGVSRLSPNMPPRLSQDCPTYVPMSPMT